MNFTVPPTSRSCDFAQFGVDQACESVSAAERLRVALVPLELEHRVDRRRVDAGDGRGRSTPSKTPGREADRRHVLDARRTSATVVGHACSGIGEKPSWFWTISAAETWSSIVLSTEARMPGGEHRDEHDEREADHQRRGGDRGALRLADRVLARELAGAGPACGPSARPARAPAAAPAAAPGTRRRTSSAPRRGRAATRRPSLESMPPKRPKNSASQAEAHQRDRADDPAPAQVPDARASRRRASPSPARRGSRGGPARSPRPSSRSRR